MHITGYLGPSSSHLRSLGHFGAILGPSWAILGHLGVLLGPSWGVLRRSQHKMAPGGAHVEKTIVFSNRNRPPRKSASPPIADDPEPFPPQTPPLERASPKQDTTPAPQGRFPSSISRRRATSAPSWGHLGVLLGSSWGSPGVLLGPSWGVLRRGQHKMAPGGAQEALPL